MTLIARLKLVFKYGPELDGMLEMERRRKADIEFEARKNHLHLCPKHKQECNHSHYAEHNCDYCKLLEENKRLADICEAFPVE
jgi:hypothetical protein